MKTKETSARCASLQPLTQAATVLAAEEWDKSHENGSESLLRIKLNAGFRKLLGSVAYLISWHIRAGSAPLALLLLTLGVSAVTEIAVALPGILLRVAMTIKLSRLMRNQKNERADR